MDAIILENEKLIESFDFNYFIEHKEYSIAASLAALDTTNKIQKSYFSQDDNQYSDALLLYALLQSLFVSIDSLYALAYGLTKSKNTININKNPNLRELKYIRNDVVGHPANRVYGSESLAYCILDTKTITKTEFSYNVYSGKGIDTKKVDINTLVEAYYVESNEVLQELLTYSLSNKRRSDLVLLASQCLEAYRLDGDYYPLLLQVKEAYLKKVASPKKFNHRLLWRIELIDELRNFQSTDADIKSLVNYAIGLELVKIYELIDNGKQKGEINRKLPQIVSSFYRLLKKNQNASSYACHLQDLKDPLFLPSLEWLLDFAQKKGVKLVTKYLKLLEKLYRQNADSLLYALALPLRDYSKKKV